MKIDIVRILEEDKQLKAFTTYRNYLYSVKQFIDHEYGNGPEIFNKLKSKIINRRAYNRIQRNKSADITKVSKLLCNAWHTEMVFFIPSQIDTELIRYSNHWAPIQSYYSIFLAIRALFESASEQCSRDHTNTLQKISEFIVNRDLFPPPWNAYCCGRKDINNLCYYNFPQQVSNVSNLSEPVLPEFWNWYAMWLRTTRERKLKWKAEELKKSKVLVNKRNKPKKKLTVNDKRFVDKGVHKTTFFDGLYRLRIRSNYEDADAFFIGTYSDVSAKDYYNSLATLLQSTLFILELYIKKYIGDDNFSQVVSKFIQSDQKNLSKQTLAVREYYF